MKQTLIFLLSGLVLAAGCGRDSGRLEREQQQYDVVEEGAAGGASSTIHAPGEISPPVPLTGTNADTTTDFTLNVPLTNTPGQPGTIAGTLPSDTGGTYYPGTPPAPRPRVSAPPTATTPPLSPAPRPSSPPPTATTEQPPSQTDTSATTPAEPKEPEPEEPEPEDEPPPPPPSETAPPPTQTQTTPPPVTPV